MPNNPYTGLANIVLYLANLNTLFLSIPFFISPILETSDIFTHSLTRIYIILLLLQKFFSRLEYRDHYDDLPLKSLLAFFPHVV